MELPAQRPSPPFSAASKTASAPESEVESAAKLSAGALRMGTRRGLFPSAWETPENQTGAKLGVMMLLVVGEIGITEAGSSLSGKCERSGVPGGGKMRENSDAKEVTRLCFAESAINKFVPFFERDTRDCGVMSSAKAIGICQCIIHPNFGIRTFCFWRKHDDMVKVCLVELYDNRLRCFGITESDLVSLFCTYMLQPSL